MDQSYVDHASLAQLNSKNPFFSSKNAAPSDPHSNRVGDLSSSNRHLFCIFVCQLFAPHYAPFRIMTTFQPWLIASSTNLSPLEFVVLIFTPLLQYVTFFPADEKIIFLIRYLFRFDHSFHPSFRSNRSYLYGKKRRLNICEINL